MVVPFEAHAQLTYLNLNGFADLVTSEDSDLFGSGCKQEHAYDPSLKLLGIYCMVNLSLELKLKPFFVVQLGCCLLRIMKPNKNCFSWFPQIIIKL